MIVAKLITTPHRQRRRHGGVPAGLASPTFLCTGPEIRVNELSFFYKSLPLTVDTLYKKI